MGAGNGRDAEAARAEAGLAGLLGGGLPQRTRRAGAARRVHLGHRARRRRSQVSLSLCLPPRPSTALHCTTDTASLAGLCPARSEHSAPSSHLSSIVIRVLALVVESRDYRVRETKVNTVLYNRAVHKLAR